MPANTQSKAAREVPLPAFIAVIAVAALLIGVLCWKMFLQPDGPTLSDTDRKASIQKAIDAKKKSGELPDIQIPAGKGN